MGFWFCPADEHILCHSRYVELATVWGWERELSIFALMIFLCLILSNLDNTVLIGIFSKP